jgi:serine phosphatase RsbU (regulator of sigma subunit)
MPFFGLAQKIRIQVFFVVLVILLFIKLFYVTSETTSLLLLNEVLILFIVYSIMVNLFSIIGQRNYSPISLLIGLVVLITVNLILFNIVELFFGLFGIEGKNIWIDSFTLQKTIPFIINVLLIISLAYVFIVFRILFFLQQRKNLRTYFNALIVFFILSSVTAFIENESQFEFIHITFTVNAIILIVINSVRISWMAFLSKKQKKQLLLLSVLLVFIFSISLAFSKSNDFFIGMVENFAPSVYQFFFLLNIYGIVYFSVLFFTTLFHLPTAEAFDRKTTEISSLQYFSKMINQVLDSKELADTVTDLALKVCTADAAWIIKQNDSSFTPIAAKNISFIQADNIVKAFFESGSVKTVQKISTLELTNVINPELQNEIFKYAAIAPLQSHQGISGYIVIAKRTDIPFDSEEKNTLLTFSDYTSIAFENSRLLEESIEKERLEKELDVAREMQKKLLPDKLPKNDFVDIAAIFIPAFEVGGDYYDFFELSKTKLGFVIADVSGKGISAAFIMAEIRGIFESLTDLLHSPKEILTKANSILERTLDAKSFITATFGVFDFVEKKIFISRAGHAPLLLIRNGEATEYTFRGIGLGLNYTELFGNVVEEAQIKLEKDDLLILYTDGITEAKNEKLEDFGINSLMKIVLENSEKNVDEIANKIVTGVTLFSESSPQHDDITLVVFRWK